MTYQEQFKAYKDEDKQAEEIHIINELIAISNELDLLWEYHPNNPYKKNVEERYIELEKEVEMLEEELRKLDDENI